MNKKLIVITGGPGTGKTTIINALIENGFCCYPEISRQITLDARKQGITHLFIENPLYFSELVLEERKIQYQNALNENHNLVFIDRGIPDVLAYLKYGKANYSLLFEAMASENSYTKIFMLPPWEEIYISDETRHETFQQSKLIYKYLVETYQSLGYKLIYVPKDAIKNRVSYILSQV